MKRRKFGAGADKVIREIRREFVGWTVERTSGGHLRFRHPGGASVIAPLTSSDYRNLTQLRATMRRALGEGRAS